MNEQYFLEEHNIAEHMKRHVTNLFLILKLKK